VTAGLWARGSGARAEPDDAIDAELDQAFALIEDEEDYRDAAFALLVGRAASDASLASSPRWNSITSVIQSPAEHRGAAGVICGRLAQRGALPAPDRGVEEWFIRPREGDALAVFVVGGAEAMFAPGAQVCIEARFLKLIDAAARDGQTRRYAAFVAHVRSVRGVDASGVRLTGVLVPIIFVMSLALAIIRVRLRRKNARTARMTAPARGPLPSAAEPSLELPSDAAEALAVLRRACKGSSSP